MPSVSIKYGENAVWNKSDIVVCLEALVPQPAGDSATDAEPSHVPDSPAVDVIILDGAAVVNMLKPGTERTFSEYATHVFLTYITTQLQNAQRVDVVWDEYVQGSLKSYTRSVRGKGSRRRVESSSTIPRNWQEFLRNEDNKRELFSFLSLQTAKLETDRQVIITHHKEVLCTQSRDTSALAPCTHEEADTRIFLHVSDAVNQGHDKVMIHTVYYVLVLAVAAVQKLHVGELWVAFATGKSFRYLPAHEMAGALGPEKCTALPFLHAFSGCDTVSSFAGRGKKTVWDVWNAFDEVTPAFCTLASMPSNIDGQIEVLEHFVVILYDRTSSEVRVNDARKHLFCQKSRPMDGLPPTQSALIEHTKRAAYQAGHIWAQMLVTVPKLPSPGEWGWQETNNGWEVEWTTLPEASKACRELLRCGCQKGCRRQCKCVKAVLQCTALCQCRGLCERD